MNSGPLIDSSTLPTRLMELLKDEGSVRDWRVNFTDSVAFFEDNYICFWQNLKFRLFPPILYPSEWVGSSLKFLLALMYSMIME